MEWGANEERQLQELAQLASGFDVYGKRISRVEQLDAMERFQRLRRYQDELKSERMRVEAEVTKAEAAKMEAEAVAYRAVTERMDVEGKLQIEADRLSIQKAELVVRMIETAVKAGMEPDKLLSATESLVNRLLPDKTDTERQKLLLLAKDNK